MNIHIDKPLLKSLLQIVSVIEARDAYTGGHLWRVSQYCRLLAGAAGLPSERIFLSSLGGFLHDIGKVGVPEVILGKRGRLNPAEYEVVKTHPAIGASLIKDHPLGDLAVTTVRQHHEWVDGGGYPGHLQGGQISLAARIVSIADAFDALTSTRSYRACVPVDAAVETLKAAQGTQFDFRLLDTFMRMYRADTLHTIVGSCDEGVPMVECPNCGPVIVVGRDARDGDTGFCRVCGRKYRLHRQGDIFVAEPTGEMGSPEELQPRPDYDIIDAFVAQAPEWIQI